MTLGRDAPRNAKPQPAEIEFADGAGATATPSHIVDDTLELAIDKYVTQKRHKVTARRRLPRPADTTRGVLPKNCRSPDIPARKPPALARQCLSVIAHPTA
ncbi:hypothetical protein [Burkholderia sp. BCC1999]|uniref:hypothetical protein n=1 Tax=Burkholderia sp. BCC1999 TaxID=2817448 RepID=UPI002AC31448|nr:hypothetical protein [Burkholderia sp. BCC1999]